MLKTDKSMEVPYNIIDLKGFGLEYYFNRDEELNV